MRTCRDPRRNRDRKCRGGAGRRIWIESARYAGWGTLEREATIAMTLVIQRFMSWPMGSSRAYGLGYHRSVPKLARRRHLILIRVSSGRYLVTGWFFYVIQRPVLADRLSF